MSKQTKAEKKTTSKVTSLKVIAPFAVYLPRKTVKDKRVPINLNWYRNADRHVSNDVKKQYLEEVKNQLKGVKLETPVKIKYKVFKPTRRRLDKMNVVSITSKFLLDAMSTLAVIPDDNDDYVKNELILPTEYDKNNGYVEVWFETVKEEK